MLTKKSSILPNMSSLTVIGNEDYCRIYFYQHYSVNNKSISVISPNSMNGIH